MAKSKRGLSYEQYKIDGETDVGLWVAYFNGEPIAECRAPIGVLPIKFRNYANHIAVQGMSPSELAKRRAFLETLR